MSDLIQGQTKNTKIVQLNASKAKIKKQDKRARAHVVEYESFYFVFTSLQGSDNPKTGDMVQTYLLDKNTITESNVFGAKCFDCPMVSKCYVSQDKLSVRLALKRLINGEKTSYIFNTLDRVLPLLKGRLIRFGSYGDPSIIPLDDIQKIVSVVRGWTGYTHFWKEIDTEYSKYFNASVESLTDELLAQGLGYKSFRVLLKGESTSYEVSENAILCLNVSKGLTCSECLLCSGTRGKGRKISIYIQEH